MKQDWEIYRDTGILGAYRPEQVILRRSEDGGVETLFRDSIAKWEGDDLTRQRAMLVGGKCFLVTSVFSGSTYRQAPAAHRYKIRKGVNMAG